MIADNDQVFRYEVVDDDSDDKTLRIVDRLHQYTLASATYGNRNAIEQLVMLANQGWEKIGHE